MTLFVNFCVSLGLDKWVNPCTPDKIVECKYFVYITSL